MGLSVDNNGSRCESRKWRERKWCGTGHGRRAISNEREIRKKEKLTQNNNYGSLHWLSDDETPCPYTTPHYANDPIPSNCLFADAVLLPSNLWVCDVISFFHSLVLLLFFFLCVYCHFEADCCWLTRKIVGKKKSECKLFSFELRFTTPSAMPSIFIF